MRIAPREFIPWSIWFRVVLSSNGVSPFFVLANDNETTATTQERRTGGGRLADSADTGYQPALLCWCLFVAGLDLFIAAVLCCSGVRSALSSSNMVAVGYSHPERIVCCCASHTQIIYST